MAGRVIETIKANTTAIALTMAGMMLVLSLVDRIGLKAEVNLCRSLAPAVGEMIEDRARIVAQLDTLEADLRMILESPAQAQILQVAELVSDIRSGI